MPAIDIRDLSVTPGGKRVLSPVTFRVPMGGTALLFGASGSGKTTLLRAIMGFAAASSGSITIHGDPLDMRTVWRARQSLLSYVPQEVDLGPGTLRDAMMRPFAFRANRHPGWDEGKAMALLGRLRLRGDIMDKRARELSGGEKHRAALAIAVMLQRPVLLLDEITAGLDRASKLATLDLIGSLTGVTVLAASHDDLFRERAGVVIEIGERSG